MTKMRKFAVLTKAKVAEVHEGRIPELGDNQVLIKQETCNICTTDFGQWLGLREHQPFPMAGGHEGAGIIAAKGKNVRNEINIGDHVAVAYDYCGECAVCQTGRTSECKEVSNPFKEQNDEGYYGHLGFATYNVKDANTIIKMNPELPFSEAGFLEPLATVISGLKRLRVTAMDRVVVIGAGTMGVLNALAAKAFGVEVIITEMMDKKIEAARSMGLNVIDIKKHNPVEKVKELTSGKGADAVIIAVGNTKANEQALEMVKEYNGRLLLFAAGYPSPELNVDSNLIHYRKMELIGTYGADISDFNISANLLNDGKVNVSKLIEAKVPLKEIQKGYTIASTEGSYRVSVLLQ
ncbi:alcohol dehydrogenase catalytic domain-containing protein [Bacillus circulans]|uniref:zinc-dependent alcohol dehydrogenase n=1 Tax=Niallia circulans TaxID=1397 RepID=UPI000F45D8C2|nr:zinc-binding dehydrogenase [Niallia circulans]AYV72669.1 alcohol dehydrogenase [Niallia circulans]NRG29393.1 alcohol dehydrogenase catalytic domain-containing protein [Niallia circulans]QJX60426.1 alcohol dehydrogenase catalytic domain-containing protein [Niallia circulans]